MSRSHRVDSNKAVVPRPQFCLHRSAIGRTLMALAAVVLLLSAAGFAQAQSLGQGVAAFKRQDYVAASRSFIPLAERGDASAQSYLGFMFETGRGVPQNYTEAAMWYRRAAEQGDSLCAIFARPALRQGFWRAAGHRRGRQMAQSVGRSRTAWRP